MILEEDKQTLCDKPGRQGGKKRDFVLPADNKQRERQSASMLPRLIGYVRSVKTAVSVQQSSFPNIA